MNPIVAALAAVLLCTIGAESKGPCLGHYPMSLRPFAGVYVPQCTPFGYFKVIQVHGSTGHSWCVNPETNAKVEESDVGPGNQPQCGKCFYELAKYYGAGHVSIGRTKPQCDEKGQFQRLQFSGSTGYSWCVNPETGEKVEGTDTKPGAEAPNCEAPREKRSRPGPCHPHRLSLRPVGQFIPKCTVSGFFQVVQSHASTGYSWCVNPETGEKIEGTEVRGEPQCGQCLYAVVAYYAPGFVSVGRPKPECDANGRFAPKQYNPSTGYTYCVNVETGERIEGTEVAPGAGQANCEAREKRSLPGPCHAIRLSLRPVGQFIPKCTVMGFFQVVQYHPSTGYSWCVNPETGDKVEGSDIRGQPECGKCLYALASYLAPGFVSVGRPRPQCDAAGQFTPSQYNPSTGYSYCVNTETGEKIEGSEVAPGAGQANCEVRFKRAIRTGPCDPSRWPMSLRPFAGIYTPQCTVFGYFKVVQTHASTGYSWCVNPETGAKIEGTDVAPGAGKQPECGKCLYDLLKYYSVGMVSVGRWYPKCDNNGNYQPLQSNAGTGYSWCVNPTTGEKIENTEVAPAAGVANC